MEFTEIWISCVKGKVRDALFIVGSFIFAVFLLVVTKTANN